MEAIRPFKQGKKSICFVFMKNILADVQKAV